MNVVTYTIKTHIVPTVATFCYRVEFSLFLAPLALWGLQFSALLLKPLEDAFRFHYVGI